LLARQGTSFANFFVPISLCCPSRTSILTGVYAHNHRVVTNTPPEGGFERFQQLGLDRETIATALHAAGYRTALMGKYLNGYPDDDHPTYIPPGWDEWEVPADDNAYGGFDYEMNENGKLVKYGHAAGDYMTDVLSQKAQAFIRHTPQPYFLYLATYAPHRPATPAPRHRRLFKNYGVPRTPSWDEADVSDKPQPFRRLRHLNPDEILAIDAIYRARLQSLQAVDEMVEALIDTLRATGQLAHTYVVFTSDNGFHMGQHRLRPGKYTAYEEDIHVPFILRGPGVPARRVVQALGVSVDLAPTFAELAGATLPAARGAPDGRSLVPLWSSRPPAPGAWRQAVLVEQRPFGAKPAAATPAAGATRAHARD